MSPLYSSTRDSQSVATTVLMIPGDANDMSD